MKHFLDLVQGFYRSEIAGVLRQPRTDRYNFDQFHKGARASKRFWEPFQIAFDSLSGSAKGASEEQTAALNTSAATAGGATGIDVEGALEDNKNIEATRDDLAAFRAQCELARQRELDSRVVMLTAVGSDAEIHASVTRTRLYQNLTEAATVMGFYDVNNSRLCHVFEGQGLTRREPALDEADFERYVKSIVPLMAMGRDVLWVPGGGGAHGREQDEAEADPDQAPPPRAGLPPLLQPKADAAVRALQSGARRGELPQSRTVVPVLQGPNAKTSGQDEGARGRRQSALQRERSQRASAPAEEPGPGVSGS